MVRDPDAGAWTMPIEELLARVVEAARVDGALYGLSGPMVSLANTPLDQRASFYRDVLAARIAALMQTTTSTP